jgi:hypothetical protein
MKMGRSKQKAKVHFNSQEIKLLPMSEIIVILRASDSLSRRKSITAIYGVFG